MKLMSKSEEDTEVEEEQETTSEEGKDTELSPEEQMALYEESLKESDWGHQPC